MSEKMENYKYFSTSLIILFLAQAFSLLIRMGSRIIIARFSSPDLYGLFSVIWNEMTLVATIALLGLGQQLTINLPREESNKKKKSILSAIVYASIMGLISLLISIILYVINNSNTYKFSLLISALFVVFLFVQFIFIGLKDFLGYFIQSVTQTLSMFIAIAVLRNMLTIDIMVYVTFGSIGLSLLVSCIYLLFRTKLPIRALFSIKINIFDFSKKRLSLFLVDIINSLIFYFMLKLPQIIIGNSYAGFVNVAFSLTVLLILPAQMIAVAMGPRISEDHHNSRLESLQNSFRISLTLLYIIQGVILLVFSYFGDYFIELLYGIKYVSESRLIFYGFLFVVIIDSFNYIYALYIRNTDHEKLFAIGKIISLFAFLGFEVLFLLVLNDYIQVAVPIAYFISTLSLLVFYFLFTMRLNKKYENKDARLFLSWLAYVLVNVICALVITNYLFNWIYLLLVTIASVVLFFGYLVISKTVNLKSLFNDLKEIKIHIRNRQNSNSEINNIQND